MIIYTNKQSPLFKDRNVSPELVTIDGKTVLHIHLAGEQEGKMIQTSEVVVSHRKNNGAFWYVATSKGNSKWLFFYNGKNVHIKQSVQIWENSFGIPRYSRGFLIKDNEGMKLCYKNRTFNLGELQSAVPVNETMEHLNLKFQNGNIEIFY